MVPTDSVHVNKENQELKKEVAPKHKAHKCHKSQQPQLQYNTSTEPMDMDVDDDHSGGMTTMARMVAWKVVHILSTPIAKQHKFNTSFYYEIVEDENGRFLVRLDQKSLTSNQSLHIVVNDNNQQSRSGIGGLNRMAKDQVEATSRQNSQV